MSAPRIYIKPFDELGSYQSSFTNITRDALKAGKIQKELDSTDYDIGIYRNSSFKLTLRNDHGRFLNVDSNKSIFNFKRADSIFKVTWDRNSEPLICGFLNCGNFMLGKEVDLFEGLLTDVSGTSNIDDQEISFNILGYESLFSKVDVPFSSISNGDNVSDVIFTCLNQTKITDLLTVSISNINLSTDQTIDVKDSLENQTVEDALAELLKISNSVLNIKNKTIYVTSRTPSSTVQYNFFGQASNSGIENVLNIKNYRDGINRLFNYWTWEDTNLIQSDSASINIYGVYKRETSSDLITDTTKRNNILSDYLAEFKDPKVELDLTTKLDLDTYALELLDKVTIDYPTVYFAADDNPVPRYGQDVYGSSLYPFGQYSLTISPNIEFKILSRSIDLERNTITFKLREV